MWCLIPVWSSWWQWWLHPYPRASMGVEAAHSDSTWSQDDSIWNKCSKVGVSFKPCPCVLADKQAGSVGQLHWPSVRISLCSSCCKLVATLSFKALRFPISQLISLPLWVLPRLQETFFFLQAPSQVYRSHPDSFLFLLFRLTQIQRDFIALSRCLNPLPAFSRHSVRIIPHVDMFFDVFVGGGELHILALQQFWCSSYVTWGYLCLQLHKPVAIAKSTYVSLSYTKNDNATYWNGKKCSSNCL